MDPQPAGFSEQAQREGHKVVKLAVSLHGGLRSEEAIPTRKRPGIKMMVPPAHPPEEVESKLKEDAEAQVTAEGKRWVNDTVAGVKEGEMVSHVIEEPESWLVVRYLQRDARKKGVFHLEGIYFPKADFESWVQAERLRVITTRAS